MAVRDRWIAERNLEFEKLYQDDTCVKSIIDAGLENEVSQVFALKLACIELARQKNQYRQYVNITGLNEPVQIAIPPAVVRIPNLDPAFGEMTDNGELSGGHRMPVRSKE
jgi:hypothetical protein